MRVGWYIHHHGSGHLQRFRAIVDRLEDVTALTSLDRPDDLERRCAWLTLAPDTPAGDDARPTAGGAWHWVPLRHPGLRIRMAAIASWIESARPDVVVCDVSVEVAALARLMGVPVVWLAQRGARLDAPHRLAYAGSTVIAPWTVAVAGPGSETGLPDDTRFVGALSRFDGRCAVPPPHSQRTLVLVGTGGHELVGAALRDAARATPDWSWTTAGLSEAVGAPVRDAGQVDLDGVWSLLLDADVVVASAGQNLVSEVAAARRPLVCLPQPRPFGEQHEQARSLARAGLAESLEAWPTAGEWPGLLARALDRDPAEWSVLHDGSAGQRLVAAIEETACESA